MARLEGRLKLLVLTSPILEANTDQINRMETSIKDAFDRTIAARQVASVALTAELSGTGRVIPTDEQLFFELMEVAKRK